MKKWILFASVFYMLPSFAVLAPYDKPVSKGKITFYKDSNTTPEQFSNVGYQFKPDQAWLESTAPMTLAMRQALSADDFKNMTQEELDQIYIRLSSGPIAPGSYKTTAMMKGNAANNVKNFLMTKFHGVQVLGSTVCGQQDVAQCFSDFAWRGIRIYAPDSSTSEYSSRTAVSKITAQAVKAVLLPVMSQLDPRNWLIRTSDDFYGESKYMIFPAHVYCGQSLLDHRKESVVIDHSWGSDFSPFINGIDNILGRDYMDIRDELRMVRPGLYLGRVYAQKIFLFNFVAYNPDADKAASQEAQWPADTCFNGKSTR